MEDVEMIELADLPAYVDRQNETIASLRAERDKLRERVEELDAMYSDACRHHRALKDDKHALMDDAALLVDAAEAGYSAGHNDTVEGAYGDPRETAEDIVADLVEDRRVCAVVGKGE